MDTKIQKKQVPIFQNFATIFLRITAAIQSISTMRIALYITVPKKDSKAVQKQLKDMNTFVNKQNWKIAKTIINSVSGTTERNKVIEEAQAKRIDSVVVWKIDQWASSLSELVQSFSDLNDLGVSFISIAESFYLKTANAKELVDLLSILSSKEKEVRRKRIKAGIALSIENGQPHGRPQTALRHKEKILRLYKEGLPKAVIARKLKIGRTSVIRILAQ